MGALHKMWEMGNGISLDSDAKAYITAAGITDATQKTSINTFVKGLKTNNLWTKCWAIYPAIGGTATAHKWNLKDPRDLDAAYRLVYIGTATHNSYGINWPNNNSILGDTKLNANTIDPTATNFGMTVYCGTQGFPLSTFIGAYDGSKHIELREGGGRSVYGKLSDTTTLQPQPAKAYFNTFGVHNINRTNANYISLFRDGILISTVTNGSQNKPNANVILANISNPGTSGWNGTYLMQFAAIHQGFSDSDAVIWAGLINDLQLNLGRKYIYTKGYSFLGDSITQGQAGNAGGFASLLCNNKNAYCFNLGVASYKTTDIISTSLPLLPTKTINDKYVICAIGINDCMSLTTTQYHDNLVTIINSLISKGYDATNIILPTIYYSSSRSANSITFNTVITGLWSTYGFSIQPDVYTYMVNNGGDSLLNADGLHPNVIGHAAIATYYESLLT